MTQEDIKECNKSIAKYMGYLYFESDVSTEDSDGRGHYHNIDVYSKKPIQIDIDSYGCKNFAYLPNPDYKNINGPKWNPDIIKLSWDILNDYTSELNYHKSWDDLMPVVKNIYTNVEQKYDKRGNWNPQYGYPPKIYTMRLNSDILEVWLEVVKYIMKNGTEL